MPNTNRTTITIDLETARLIQSAFLPRNENKMRGADPRVVAAVKEFKNATACAFQYAKPGEG